MKKTIISISGNIAAGKTTLIKKFLKNIDQTKIHFIKEDIQEWNKIPISNDSNLNELNIETYDIFNQFLKNINSTESKYSLALQEIIRYNYIENIFNSDKEFIITERSIFDNFFIFETSLYKNNNLDQLQFSIAKYIIKKMINTIHNNFNFIILHLNTSYDKSYEQMLQRGIESEITNYSIEYLKNIDTNHNTMINNLKNIFYIKSCNFDEAYDYLIEIYNKIYN